MKTKTLMLSLCISVTLASCESQEQKQVQAKLQSEVEQSLFDSISSVEAAKVEAKTKEEVSDYTGTYKREDGLELIISKPIKNDVVEFTFGGIVNQECAEGEVSGKAKLVKPDFALDNSGTAIEGVNYSFTFYPNGVVVSEYRADGEEWAIHGAHCGDLNGNFKK